MKWNSHSFWSKHYTKGSPELRHHFFQLFFLKGTLTCEDWPLLLSHSKFQSFSTTISFPVKTKLFFDGSKGSFKPLLHSCYRTVTVELYSKHHLYITYHMVLNQSQPIIGRVLLQRTPHPNNYLKCMAAKAETNFFQMMTK